MDRKIASHEVDALRVEALEARRLAETLGDSQAILDLQNYAAELEAEAAQISLRTNCQVTRLRVKHFAHGLNALPARS